MLIRHVLGHLLIGSIASGDTGGAALAAFSGRDDIDIFLMFPENRVLPVHAGRVGEDSVKAGAR